jgi:hypothetical protein
MATGPGDDRGRRIASIGCQRRASRKIAGSRRKSLPRSRHRIDLLVGNEEIGMMARPKTRTDETADGELSVGGGLCLLVEQQSDLGERIRRLAGRAEIEIETLRAEVQERTAELGEARVELAEVRAALEIETMKRAAAGARAGRLEKVIAKIRAAADEADVEADEVTPAVEVANETENPPAAASAESLGLTSAELAAVDVLVARGDAPDRTSMLRTLILRALSAEGVMSGNAAPPADREEALDAPS